MFTALSDEVNNELDVKWSEMKSYNEGGSGVVFLLLLLAMVALACFNIWRKLRKRPGISIEKKRALSVKASGNAKQ